MIPAELHPAFSPCFPVAKPSSAQCLLHISFETDCSRLRLIQRSPESTANVIRRLNKIKTKKNFNNIIIVHTTYSSYIMYYLTMEHKPDFKLKLETKAMTTSSQCDTGRTCLSLSQQRKILPAYTRCTENHSNTCAENRKIRGLKFDTLYWRHLAAYRKI